MATTTTETMKAVQIHAFGGPEVLQYEDVPQPQPKANEILVLVHAAGVNPVDWKIREGHLSGALPMIMGLISPAWWKALAPELRNIVRAMPFLARSLMR